MNIDREYAYKPAWMVIVGCGVFFAVCAGILTNVAATNDRGLVINGIIRFSEHGATIFYWILSGLAVAFVVGMLLLVGHRVRFRQRIAITKDSVILPKSRWSSEEVIVNYRAITNLSGIEVNGQRFLYVDRGDGKRLTVCASLMPNKDAFDELCAILRERSAK